MQATAGLHVQTIVDPSVFQQHNAIIQRITTERDELQKKYTTILEMKEKEHQQEVQALKNRITELTVELERYKTQTATLETQVGQLTKDVKTMQRQQQRQRKMLLLGSVAYAVIDVITELVFGRAKLNSLLPTKSMVRLT